MLTLRKLQDFKEQDVVPLGHWSNATDGRQQWQWEIYSPGAESHLLIFRSASLFSMRAAGP